MPHYADGTEAHIKDVVQGRGYNVKNEIVGTVVDIRQGDSCNLTVAYIEVGDPFVEPLTVHDIVRAQTAHVGGVGNPAKPLYIKLEYGDTKGFQKLV